MFKHQTNQSAPQSAAERSSLTNEGAKSLVAQLANNAQSGIGTQAAEAAVPEYFGSKNLQSRLKQYASASGHNKVADYLRMYEKEQAQQALELSDEDESDDSLAEVGRESP